MTKKKRTMSEKIADAVARSLEKSIERNIGGYPPPCVGLRFQPKRPAKPQAKKD